MRHSIYQNTGLEETEIRSQLFSRHEPKCPNQNQPNLIIPDAREDERTEDSGGGDKRWEGKSKTEDGVEKNGERQGGRGRTPLIDRARF